MTPDHLQRLLNIYQQKLADEQLRTATLTLQLEDALAGTRNNMAGAPAAPAGQGPGPVAD